MRYLTILIALSFALAGCGADPDTSTSAAPDPLGVTPPTCTAAYWEQRPSCAGDLVWCRDDLPPPRPGELVTPVIGPAPGLWCLDGPPSSPHLPGVPQVYCADGC